MVARASNIVRFSVSCFNVKSLRAGNDRRYVRTMLTSHVVEYLGRDGLSSKVPFRKQVKGMFSKSLLVRWCNSRGQGRSSSVDSTVTDPVFVK